MSGFRGHSICDSRKRPGERHSERCGVGEEPQAAHPIHSNRAGVRAWNIAAAQLPDRVSYGQDEEVIEGFPPTASRPTRPPGCGRVRFEDERWGNEIVGRFSDTRIPQSVYHQKDRTGD